MDWNDDDWFGLPSGEADRIYWVEDPPVTRVVMQSHCVHWRSAKRKHHRRRIKVRQAVA